VYIYVHTNTSDVCAGRAEAKVLLLYTASHEFACLARGRHWDICVITCLNFLFAAVQVWFDALNYNVTEGGTVDITLVTDTTDYEFDFSVSLLDTMNGSATGEWLIYVLITPQYAWATGLLQSSVFVCTTLHSNYSLRGIFRATVAASVQWLLPN